MFESGTDLATDRWHPTAIQRGDAVAFAASGDRIFALMYDGGVSGVYRSADAGAGAHRVLFNASSLPGGVYAYRLTVGGASQTRHMLLLK